MQQSIRKRRLLWGLAVCLLPLVLFPKATSAEPSQTVAELSAAGYAKVLGSAVFVSGRNPEEAKRNSAFLFMPDEVKAQITNTVVDRDRKEVRVTLSGGVTRTARFYGDQGCVILPKGQDEVFFKPVAVKTKLPDATTLPWPMGDLSPNQAPPAGIDMAGVKKAIDLAFSDAEALTAAFLVVYKGQIVGERYDLGVTKDTQLESWSMGKSLTAALVGMLIKDGHFGLYDPAPVAEWQKMPGDPRAKIRIADLLRMSSGLRFTSRGDSNIGADQYPDHVFIYAGAVDAFKFSYSKPLEFPPNTVGRYRNCDPLTLGHIIKETVTKRGEEYLTFPQRALFDKIGIRKMVLETDPYGNFLLTGFDYGTARNWARLGLLYLQNGVWQKERLLPEGFVEFVHTPAPAWKQGNYGGLFWLNPSGDALPKDAYNMAGAGNQKVFIVPSLDLVVVRMGHMRGEPRSGKTLNAALKALRGAIQAD